MICSSSPSISLSTLPSDSCFFTKKEKQQIKNSSKKIQAHLEHPGLLVDGVRQQNNMLK